MADIVDKQIAELPAASGVTDDTLIPVYVPGSSDPAQALNGKQFKDFAKEGVSAYVEAAQNAAKEALAAAQRAQDAVASVQDAANQAAAAEAAAEAAQAAMEAAEEARKAAEAAAELAAQQAAGAAEAAATDAVANVDAALAEYVAAAQSAQAAAEAARDQAQAIAGGNFLPLAGGALTGPLVLAGAPTEDLQAATKKYVDDAVKNKQDALTGTEGQVVGFDADGKPVAKNVSVDSEPTEGSVNPVSSGAVYTAINAIDTLIGDISAILDSINGEVA